jgi:hypothetical protein
MLGGLGPAISLACLAGNQAAAAQLGDDLVSTASRVATHSEAARVVA